jgi:hypothetical protein
MNTDLHHQQPLLETDPNTIPPGEFFVSFAIAVMAVATLYLVVALLAAFSPWTQSASAATAAWTAGLC